VFPTFLAVTFNSQQKDCKQEEISHEFVLNKTNK
jgi:hypothetical protein